MLCELSCKYFLRADGGEGGIIALFEKSEKNISFSFFMDKRYGNDRPLYKILKLVWEIYISDFINITANKLRSKILIFGRI